MDVRSLIKACKTNLKRIDHPHIKYTSLGRISCLVCGIPIKSELTWKAHILSKTHKDNALKGTASLKRLQSHVQQSQSTSKLPKLEITNVTDSAKEINLVQVSAVTATSKKHCHAEKPPRNSKLAEPMIKPLNQSGILPEGFFDDARRDAEARRVPFKDKLDSEMEIFQKELGSLHQESEQILEKDNSDMVTERNLQEVDTQMSMWEKIHCLEVEKERRVTAKMLSGDVCAKTILKKEFSNEATVNIKREVDDDDDVSEIGDDEDLDALEDFRCKTQFR